MKEPPPLIEIDSFTGSDFQERWDAYIEEIYQRYLSTVAQGKLTFRGQRVACQFRPETYGKHYAFWRMMQEGYLGTSEDDRTPDFERCKRVDWIAWAINNAGKSDAIRVFPQRRRGREKSWAVWVHEKDYVVILWDRRDYYLLKTAFVVKSGKRKELQRDWEAYNS
jgi:murein L,D-transpeptidase YafK